MKNFVIVLLALTMLSLPLFATNHPATGDPTEQAIVRVYRPANIVGFGWIFKLKANGEKVARVKNGRHLMLNLAPGQTEFKMNGKQMSLDLKPGTHYYLRASLVRNLLLGKPELVEVTPTYAVAEMAALEIDQQE